MRKVAKQWFVFILLAGFSFSYTLWGGEVAVDLQIEKMNEIPNAVLLDAELAAGGAPSARGLGQAAEQGIRTVIDFRDPKEGTAQSKDYADAVGLRYFNIPVTLDHFSVNQADEMAVILKDPKTGPALLYCASGQRATAVWALYRNRHEGISAQKAIEDAKAKGLKKPELIIKLEALLK